MEMPKQGSLPNGGHEGEEHDTCTMRCGACLRDTLSAKAATSNTPKLLTHLDLAPSCSSSARHPVLSPHCPHYH